ncbi:hypothetical protein ACEYW6_36340, partial [Nostoc sp. UIC 10607]|uniref:hypothetical protein n=1 Tax=Nostoc sp. UIC 10607 TaxID=3045935 RepID=UPI0039A1E1CF
MAVFLILWKSLENFSWALKNAFYAGITLAKDTPPMPKLRPLLQNEALLSSLKATSHRRCDIGNNPPLWGVSGDRKAVQIILEKIVDTKSWV